MNYISVVRGTLKSSDLAEAQAAHDAIVAKLSAMVRPLGAIGHQPHLNPQNPNQFLAIDTWNNLEALQQFLGNPAVAAELGTMFASPPDVSVWAESGWAAFRDY
jgi:quinol monooxygenase YgiN